MDKSHRILIVEDEPTLAELVQDYLRAAGFDTVVIHDGSDAAQWLQHQQADLIVLDLMLPGMDGIEFCKLIRKSADTPIVMATAKVEEIDRILGLNIGADDYICKPYSPKELIARIRAILRRVHPLGEENSATIKLNPDQLSLSIDGKTSELTLIEFRLFELLSREPGKIFSRQYIMDNIYNDYRVVSDRTVDSHIKKLRKKIQELSPNKQLIHSIYGAGYKFEDQ